MSLEDRADTGAFLRAASSFRVGDPKSRGMLLLAQREAISRVWGESGIEATLARLPDDVREATDRAQVVGWYPTRYMVAWHDAVMWGPAAADETSFRAYIDAAVDVTFARLQRALMRIATPKLLLERGTRLWRSAHTHGATTLNGLEPGLAHFELRDHPFIESQTGRLAFAEVVRHILSLCAMDVRESHALRNGALAMTLQWRA